MNREHSAAPRQPGVLDALSPSGGGAATVLDRRLAAAGLRLVGAIPARVIRRDAAAWRDSVLLDRGASSASDPNDWGVSHRFVDVGGDAGVSSGMAVLAGEVLVGRVLTSAPYTSVASGRPIHTLGASLA